MNAPLEYPHQTINRTPVRLYTLPHCGHKFQPTQEPRHRNCPSCWFAFFTAHPELVESCVEVFTQFGENGIRQLRGPKFASNYVRFAATLDQWKQKSQPAQEGDPQ